MAKQVALKKALLKACHTDGENPSDPEVLARLAGEAGLGGVLAGGAGPRVALEPFITTVPACATGVSPG